MRYFCYCDMDDDESVSTKEYTEEYNNRVVTVSEEDVRRDYYPFWYGKMCKKFGKEHVDKTYSFEDCLDDWIVVYWAWESK